MASASHNNSAHARQLASLLTGRRAHVNLIPFNDVEGLPYRRPSTESLQAFVNVLQQGGISVKVRKRKGSQIDAACGQLAGRVIDRTTARLGDKHMSLVVQP